MYKFEGFRAALNGCTADADDGLLDQPLPFNLGLVGQSPLDSSVDAPIGTREDTLQEVILARTMTDGPEQRRRLA